MEKLTLSVRDKEKIRWAKSYAQKKKTSVSRLFETYIESLREFENREVSLSNTLQSLRQPGERPSEVEIDQHLQSRRKRRPGH